jgi:hypothetical protein
MMGVGGFKKQYEANPNNIVLTSNPKYEKFKNLYEAEKAVPKKGLLAGMIDTINPFSSASAAEKPTVPNLSLGYTMPTFDLGTGITNTTAATPVKIGIQDILSQYNVPGLRSQNLQEDLVQQIIAENQARTNPFVRPNMLDIAGGIVPGGITQTKNLGMDTSYGVASEPDVEQVKSLTEEAPSQGLASLKNLIPGSLFGTLLSGIFGKDPPEVRAIKDFYARNFGVNTAGSIASGIMKGYNPVSGGFLHYMTGGKYGEPMQVGLAPAIRRRIENIAKRKAPQTEASRAKIAELQRLAAKDTNIRARAAAPDVYSKAESLGLIGPGGSFKSAGTNENFSNKTGRGRTGY